MARGRFPSVRAKEGGADGRLGNGVDGFQVPRAGELAVLKHQAVDSGEGTRANQETEQQGLVCSTLDQDPRPIMQKAFIPSTELLKAANRTARLARDRAEGQQQRAVARGAGPEASWA